MGSVDIPPFLRDKQKEQIQKKQSGELPPFIKKKEDEGLLPIGSENGASQFGAKVYSLKPSGFSAAPEVSINPNILPEGSNKNKPVPQPTQLDFSKDDPLGDKIKELKLAEPESDVTKRSADAYADVFYKKRDNNEMAAMAFTTPEEAGSYLSNKISNKNVALRPKKELAANETESIFRQPENVQNQTLDKFDLKDIAASVDPNNLTENVAFYKYQKDRNIKEAIKGNGISEEAALKYSASQSPQVAAQLDKLKGLSKDKYDAYVGAQVLNFLYNPDVIEKAKNDPKLKEQWVEKENNLYNDYPTLAKRIVAQKIAQAREDRGDGGLLLDIPGKASTDDLVEKLMKEGKLDARDKEVYETQIRPQFGAFKSLGRGIGNIFAPAFTNDAPIPTTDLLGSTLDSYKNTLRNVAHSVEDLANVQASIQPFVQKPFDEKQRVADILQRDYSTVTVDPKTFFSEAAQSMGHLTGFILPMIVGGEAGAAGGLSRTSSELITNGLMFEGQNRDAALMMFPDNKAKQFLYTAIATGGDMMLGKLLPTEKAAAGIKNTLRPEIEKIVNDFTENKITSDVAKKTLFDKGKELIAEKFPELLKENTKVGAVMSGFSMFHNGLDAAFGGRDVSFDDAANDAVQSFKSGFIGSLPLTLAGMSGKDSKITGKVLMEMAENRDFFKEKMENDAILNPELEATKNERIANLNEAQIINNDLKETDLTDAQKQKYLLNALVEKIWQKKADATNDETIKEDYLKKAADVKEVKDKIWNGEDKAPEFQEETTLTEDKIKTGEGEFKAQTPEEKIVELVNNGIVLGGAEMAVKADPSQATEALRFIAQQAYGITETGEPATGGKAEIENKEALAAAKERFPTPESTLEKPSQASDVVGKGDEKWKIGDVIPAHDNIPEKKIKSIEKDLGDTMIKVEFEDGTKGGIPKNKAGFIKQISGTKDVETGVSQEKPTSVKGLIDAYEEGGISTINDLVSSIEDYGKENGNADLLSAVDKFRREQEYDRSISGRGDYDQMEKEFIDAIKKAEPSTPSQEGGGAKLQTKE